MHTSPAAALHASNLLTYGGVCLAIAAVAAAAHGSTSAAGASIAGAVVADTFDGRFARSFTRSAVQQRFGAELDSLADALAFGLAPAACTALLLRSGSSPAAELAWWISAFAYAAAAITRLACFNLHGLPDQFVGLPVPIAALIWATTLLGDPGWLVSAVVLGGTAAAMVSPLPIPRPSGTRLALFACWPAALIVAHAAALVS